MQIRIVFFVFPNYNPNKQKFPTSFSPMKQLIFAFLPTQMHQLSPKLENGGQNVFCCADTIQLRMTF